MKNEIIQIEDRNDSETEEHVIQKNSSCVGMFKYYCYLSLITVLIFSSVILIFILILIFNWNKNKFQLNIFYNSYS